MGLRSECAQKYVACLEMRRPQLVALLHRIGFSWQDAEDAAQQAMIEAVKLIEAEAVESLQDRWAWLIAVAHNKARAVRRQQKHWLPLDPDALAVDPFAAGEDEEELPVHLALARSAFDRLPRRLKEIFTYVYLEGNSYREAAHQFRVGPGVVSRQLRQARDLLRSELTVLPQFRARIRHIEVEALAVISACCPANHRRLRPLTRCMRA
jgi:RNA polymerase sigma factor (sigma-70 family)